MQPPSWTIKDDGCTLNRLPLETDLISGGNGQARPQTECEGPCAPAEGAALNSRWPVNRAPELSRARG